MFFRQSINLDFVLLEFLLQLGDAFNCSLVFYWAAFQLLDFVLHFLVFFGEHVEELAKVDNGLFFAFDDGLQAVYFVLECLQVGLSQVCFKFAYLLRLLL